MGSVYTFHTAVSAMNLRFGVVAVAVKYSAVEL
jgi:hypothetical protein